VRPTVLSPTSLFRLSFFLSIICLAIIAAFLVLTTGISQPGDANYVKTEIIGKGSGSGLHEGSKLSDEFGFDNATAVDYSYQKSWNNHDAAESQMSEFALKGVKGTYWNRHIVSTKEDVAGHEVVYRISSIEGSYYGKSGMDISFSEADGREQLDSAIYIDTLSGNATIQLDVTRWDAEGSESKPADLEDIMLVGQYVIESILKLKEPLAESEKGWLEFCESINRDVIMSNETGFYIAPAGWIVDRNRNLIPRTNSTE